MTVDTGHVVVSATTTRENLYVSMTRGRESNIAYVALDQPNEIHAAPEDDEVTARTVLYGVLQHSDVELSAHQAIEAEQGAWSSIAQIAAEYETLAATAQRDRWASLLRRSGLTADQADVVIASDAFGPPRREGGSRGLSRQVVVVSTPSLEDDEPPPESAPSGAEDGLGLHGVGHQPAAVIV